MKRRTIIAAASSAALLASCGQSSDITEIYGKVGLEGVDEVNILVPDMKIDTLVPVKDGKFYVEVPTNTTVLGSVAAAGSGVQFIPDGTALDVTLSAESSIVSRTPAKSVQARLSAYQEKSVAMQDGFSASVESIMSDGSLSEEARKERLDSNYNAAIESFVGFNEATVSENTDNILSVFALQQVAMLSGDEKTDSLIGILSPVLRESPVVKSMKADIETRMETSEGKMFKDFTVEDSNGKTEKLSDYVGKGKYVLVDFWASWCGPCKAEIPNIKNIYKKYRKKGLEVLSVAVWDDPQATRDTAKAYGVNWKQIVNAQRIPTELYGIQGIPHIILFAPDGTILKRDLRGEAIEAEIMKYIE